MHRQDNSNYLLFIEPKSSEKSETPLNDEWTALMQAELESAKRGTANYSDLACKGSFTEGSGWRGMHITECGKASSNKEYLLSNGLITNSLAVFYLQYYRDSIGESDWQKLEALKSKVEYKNIWKAKDLVKALTTEYDWAYMDSQDDWYTGKPVISTDKVNEFPEGSEHKGKIERGNFYFNKSPHSLAFKVECSLSNAEDAMAYIALNGEVVIISK